MWKILTPEQMRKPSAGGLYVVEFQKYYKGDLITLVKIGKGSSARFAELVRDMVDWGYYPDAIAYVNRINGEYINDYSAERNLHDLFAEKRVSPSINEFGFKGGTEVFKLSLNEVIEQTKPFGEDIFLMSLPVKRKTVEYPDKKIEKSIEYQIRQYLWLNYHEKYGSGDQEVYEKYCKGFRCKMLWLENADRFTLEKYLNLDFHVALGFRYNWFDELDKLCFDINIDWFAFRGNNPFPNAPLKGTSEYNNYVLIAREIERHLANFVCYQWILLPDGVNKLMRTLEVSEKIHYQGLVAFLAREGVRTHRFYLPTYFDKRARKNLYATIRRNEKRSLNLHPYC